MDNMDDLQSQRRQFLGLLASGAAAFGLGVVAGTVNLQAAPFQPQDPKDWVSKIQGEQRLVIDVPHANDIYPFAWARDFIVSAKKSGMADGEAGLAVVLRQRAIAYALDNNLWESHAFGKLFDLEHPITKTPATTNPFWKPAKGEFNIPGIGEVQIGINELQERGVLFCVCNLSMDIYSAVAAERMGKSPESMKMDWSRGILPGIQVVTSGVLAIQQAQRAGCQYLYAG